MVAGCTLAIVFLGVLEFRRARAIAEALEDFARTLSPADVALGGIANALASTPGEPALLLLHGTALEAREGEADRAAASFEALARTPLYQEEVRPQQALARCALAVLALERARRAQTEAERKAALDVAEDHLGRAEAIAPQRPEPRALLGAVAIERGELERAIERFEAAERSPEPPTFGGLLTLYVGRAAVYERRGDNGRAVIELKKAVHAAPWRKDLVDRLARAMARWTADPKLSVADAKEAIAQARRALLPIHPLLRVRKAPLYALEARHLSVIREAIGLAEARTGDLEGARRTLERALEEAGSSAGAEASAPGAAQPSPVARVARNLGVVHVLLFEAEKREGVRREHAKAAARRLALAADNAPEGRDTFELRLASGIMYTRAGLYPEASRALEAASRLDPKERRLLAAYAVLLDLWGKPREAIAAYRRAIETAPGSSASYEMEERVRVLEEKHR